MPDTYHEEPEDFKDDLVSKRRFGAPKFLRHGEVREGGYIIVERTRKKRLLRPSAWPVEIDSLAAAFTAAKRMKRKRPEKEFCIFEQIGTVGSDE